MNSMPKMTLILLLLTVLADRASADAIVPIESVGTFVNIRSAPDASSEVVGRLHQGNNLKHLRSVDGWHQVQLEGGGTGYISADWSLLIGAEETAVNGAIESSSSDSATKSDTKLDTDSSKDSIDAGVNVAEPAVEGNSPPDRVATKQPDLATGEEFAREEVTEPQPQEIPGEPPATGADIATETPAAAASTPVAEPELPDSAAQPGEDDTEKDTALAGPGDAARLPDDEIVPVVPSYAAPTPATNVEGSVDYLARFIAPTELANSQVFDNGRNVGIGTNDPKQRLEVNGNIEIHEQNSNVAGLIISQASGDSGYIMHNGASTLTIGAGSVDRITITRDGNAGFGVNRPSHPLEMSSGAHVTAGGVWTNSSSREKKENIEKLGADEALAALVTLQPVQFNYKTDRAEQYVGFIAEDVPDLVATADRSGLSAMDIVAVLTSVVQQQQKRIDDLEARLNESIPVK